MMSRKLGMMKSPQFEEFEPRLLLNGASAAPNMPDLVDTFDTGFSATDNVTKLDNSDPSKALDFLVSGTVPGASVTVYAGSTAIGSAAASDVTTLVTTDGAYDLSDGVHSVTARQTEPGKTESEASAAAEVTVDTASPPPPALQPGLDVEYLAVRAHARGAHYGTACQVGRSKGQTPWG